jgi:hypothetical protein
MGKGLDNQKVQLTLKIITGVLCSFNFFVVIYSVSKLFDSGLSALVIITFFLTYFMPPLVFDTANTCKSFFKRFLPSLFAYLLCMPLYLIVFQLYSYANLHDVSWGNRDPSADSNLQQ